MDQAENVIDFTAAKQLLAATPALLRFQLISWDPEIKAEVDSGTIEARDWKHAYDTFAMRSNYPRRMIPLP